MLLIAHASQLTRMSEATQGDWRTMPITASNYFIPMTQVMAGFLRMLSAGEERERADFACRQPGIRRAFQAVLLA
jgi:hypothetical protein